MSDEQGEGDRETGGVEVSGDTEDFSWEGAEAEETHMYTSRGRDREKEGEMGGVRRRYCTRE